MELVDRILSLLKEICSELTYLKCILGKFLHVLERIQLGYYFPNRFFYQMRLILIEII